jgi:hypothetical protein
VVSCPTSRLCVVAGGRPGGGGIQVGTAARPRPRGQGIVAAGPLGSAVS